MIDYINSLGIFDATSEPILKYCIGKGIDIGASANSIGVATNRSVDTQDIKLNDKEITFLCSCDAIAVQNNMYDFIVARHILEHLNNPIKAIKEWQRILKPHGKMVVIMPDCRLYITDRKRYEISEVSWQWMAEIEMLVEDFKNCIPNNPEDWRNYKDYHHAYYYGHKYLWRLIHAKKLFEFMGFTVIENRESKEEFVEIFERDLLGKYINSSFRLDLETKFYFDILGLQKKYNFETLGFSFFLVVDNVK